MSRQIVKKEYIASWLRIDEFEEDEITCLVEKSTLFDENEGEEDDDVVDGDLWL